MSAFTIKNLREVEDSAPKFGFEAVQEARFAQDDLEAERTGLSLHRVKPGQRQGFAHRHDEAEEVYVVLSGSGRMKVDEAVLDVGPLDAIRVAPTAVRTFEGGPEGLEVLAFGPHHPGDGAIVPAHWD
jgi:mannose-6-phosphate isomerase-like protein (cupin superfamily)